MSSRSVLAMKNQVRAAATPAIKIDGLWEKFRLYHDRSTSLKEFLVKFRRARYEEFWALKNVSLTVNRGDIFGIIGENGSGKSTLLKCIAQILQPDRGTIKVNGRVSALIELGAGFHPDLTGSENVYLNGAILGLSRRQVDERFEDIVRFAELEDFIDMPVRSYSSGMYLRLGFSVAVHTDPEILLIDEVLAVGDEAFQAKCSDKFEEMKAQGKTILLVSHSLDAVRKFCSHVALLEDGEVRMQGSVEKVIDYYVETVYRKQEKDLKQQANKQEDLEQQAETVKHVTEDRWGSFEAVLSNVRLTDSSGEERYVFRCSEEMILEMTYKAHKRIEKPVFGLVVYRADGVLCTVSNTEYGGLPIRYIEGEGSLRYKVPSTLLLPGSYAMTVHLYDHTCKFPFDHHEKRYHFRIIPGENTEKWGVFHLPAKWERLK